jgi:AcrR family transcriptional regulator
MSSDRRIQILSAAGKCFAKFGYEKTTLDDIGSMVGINKVSLYHYIKSKEAIFVELISIEADQYSALLVEKVKSVKHCKRRILTWIEEGFKYGEANTVLRQFSLESLSTLAPQLQALRNRSMSKGLAFLSSSLKEGQQAAEVVPCDTDKVAQAIQTIVYAMKDSAYQRARLDSQYEVNVSELAQDILYAVSLVLDGLTISKSK